MSDRDKQAARTLIKEDFAAIRQRIEEAESALLGGNPFDFAKRSGVKRTKDPDKAHLVLCGVEEDLKRFSRATGESAKETPTEWTDFETIMRDASMIRCQISGLRRNFRQLLDYADRSLQHISSNWTVTRETGPECGENEVLEARALGYQGFALLKLGKCSEALSILERAKTLFDQKSLGRLEKEPKQIPTLAEARVRRESAAVLRGLSTCYKVCGVAPPLPQLTKYPRTAHLFDAGGTSASADDVILSADDALLRLLCGERSRVIVEEKVDGANLGISLCPISKRILVQNRSHYISSGEHAQFSPVAEWVETHRSELFRILSEGSNATGANLILYGEWVVARHSIPYGRLPGYFVAFDLYDRDGDFFFSRRAFHRALRGSRIPVVPTIAQEMTFGPYLKHGVAASAAQWDRAFSRLRTELVPLLNTPSRFRSDGGTVEGIVLRIDDDMSPGLETQASGGSSTGPVQRLSHKCKIVRPDFIRGCADGHWLSRPVEKQRVDYDFAESYLEECYVFAPPGGEGEGLAAAAGNAGLEVGDAIVSSDNSEVPQEEGNAEGTEAEASAPVRGGSRRTEKASAKERRDREARVSRARRKAPRCVVLSGLPAAGKSTFAARLAAGFDDGREEIEKKTAGVGWTVVNQDRMGKKECVAVAGRASRGKGRVVVDRCNPNRSERDEWVDILHSPPRGELALVFFATNVETCISRAGLRTEHETIPFGRGERIIRDMARHIEEPTEEERRNVYGSVDIVRSSEDADAILCRWGVDEEGKEG